MWLLCIAALFIDAGMSLIMIEHPAFSEGNDTVQSYMDDFGEKGGLLLSVGLRMLAIGFLMVVNEVGTPMPDWMYPLIIIPFAVYPVIWNTWLIVTFL